VEGPANDLSNRAVTGQECAKLRDAAKEQFPNETLGRVEITRRFALAGIERTKRLTKQDRARQAYELRSSQAVAGPDGDKPRTSLD
jgi:hypothetical protein